MAGYQRSISLSMLAAYDNQLILSDITKEKAYIQTYIQTNKQRAKCMCMCYLRKFLTKPISLYVIFENK